MLGKQRKSKIDPSKSKKKTQQNQDQIQDDLNSEDIDLEDNQIDQNNVPKKNGGYDSDLEENQDRLRLKLAKKIIEQTKSSLKSKSKKSNQDQEDDFFLADNSNQTASKQEAERFVGVERDDEAEEITQILQQKILKDHKKVFYNYAQNLKTKFEENDQGKNFATSYLKGHTQCITSLEYDHPAKFLYSTSKDGSLIKWDLNQDEKIILNYGHPKDPQGHHGEILCCALNFDGRILITGGSDKTIKLWDMNQGKVVETFKGHRGPVTGLQFGFNSNSFCSVSHDRTFKVWDGAERAYIDTFFGHQNSANCIDAMAVQNFVTGGYDKQAIIWKVENSSQLIYSGCDYSIDCIRATNPECFVTGSQNGFINLWNSKQKQPVYTLASPHGENKWITSVGNIFNTDILASGSHNDEVNFYKLEEKRIHKIFSLPSNGIINDIKFSEDCSMCFWIQSQEHRLGRWITSTKAQNRIKVVKF